MDNDASVIKFSSLDFIAINVIIHCRHCVLMISINVSYMSVRDEIFVSVLYTSARSRSLVSCSVLAAIYQPGFRLHG